MSEETEYKFRTVPRDAAGRLELLATRPRLWEYLLFGNVLYTARARFEEKWRDYQLGYTMKIGPEVPAQDIPDTMSERMSRASAIVSNLERIISPTAQLRAFGESDDDGNPSLIEHMAKRLMDLYGLLLEWVEDTRALRVPDWADRLKDLVSQFANQPVQQTHDFVDDYISSLERAIDNLIEEGSSREEVTLHITYEIDDSLVQECERELERVKEEVIRAKRK
jgi:hypothetical protein